MAEVQATPEAKVLVQIGDAVTYTDENARPHRGLVTAVFTEDCINIVYVNPDANMTDIYGRQIVRETSCTRRGVMSAPGRWWEPLA